MNKKEFALWVMAIKTYYPKENILPNEDAVALWYEQLKDIPYQTASLALNKWVQSNKWSPSIAEIRELAIMHDVPDWGEAWEEVMTAVRKYGAYQTSKALESLTPLTRKATERIGFKNICMSEEVGVERANFRMIYEKLAERERKEAQLSPKVKGLIDQIRQNMIEEGV